MHDRENGRERESQIKTADSKSVNAETDGQHDFGRNKEKDRKRAEPRQTYEARCAVQGVDVSIQLKI